MQNESASWKEIWGSREMTSHSGRKNIRQRPHLLDGTETADTETADTENGQR